MFGQVLDCLLEGGPDGVVLLWVTTLPLGERKAERNEQTDSQTGVLCQHLCFDLILNEAAKEEFEIKTFN